MIFKDYSHALISHPMPSQVLFIDGGAGNLGAWLSIEMNQNISHPASSSMTRDVMSILLTYVHVDVFH